MEVGLDTAQIDDEIIAPALWHVGDLWERGEISVADEHIATEISIRVLALQREAQRVARTRGEYRVVLAAPPGELHVVALRMVDNLLRNAGYDVAMLGSDVPTEALATLMQPPAAERRLHDLDDVRTGRRGAGERSARCSGAGRRSASSSAAAAWPRACSRDRVSTSVAACPMPWRRWTR